MISYLYNALIYKPMYNGLIFLIDVVPWADAGIAIIILTVVIKLILFPLSKKSVQTQLKMRSVQPQLDLIKEKYKNDKQEQAKKTMEFYKQEGIRPFAGILLIFIQLPIIFALYRVFLHPEVVNREIIYPFLSNLANIGEVNLVFLGLVDISGKSLVLAALAAITTFFQVRYSMPPVPKKKETSAKPNFQEDFARGMNLQMRYVFPVLAFFISWSISGAIALYFIVSNLFTIGQELVIRKSLKD